MPPFVDLIALIALGFCALLGLGSLFVPKWAAGVVRLTADPDPDKPGGFSEFRATYGGLLLLLHLTAAVILWQLSGNTNTEIVLMKIFMLMPIAAAWFGAGLGRTMSLLLDGKENREPGMIPIWIPTELALGLAIAAPVLQLV
ncbi:hypothetical protein RYZ27_04755 [Hyphomonas sp. FCG-A18]|uniref:DUF4345 family protein n=1 Tax=Hyphomonas sp. FCG-A18 TaxID=3080019 RepID=UPI002B299293|nr:hypothetical protein RYZ27_04755 [Hyphomonas sp. FCG-A18]